MPIITSRASAAYGAGFGAVTTRFELLGSYDALANVIIPSGGVTSVSFAGIPLGYHNVQIRTSLKITTGTPDVQMRFNDDTASNYRFHILRGDTNGAVLSEAYTGPAIGNPVSNIFQDSIIDIGDYASPSKTKVSKVLIGRDANPTGETGQWSMLWYATPQPIYKITFTTSTGTAFAEHSTFALYGVK